MKLKQNIWLILESRQLCKISGLDNTYLKQVKDLKYLGENINQRNDMHNEIKIRHVSTNKGYHKMRSMLSSRLLSRETKTKLYITYLRPIAMYACETWSTTKDDELN